MKKIVSLSIAAVLAAASLVSLSGCGSSKGLTVAVPNDTTNEARALLLLQDNGIIKLKNGDTCKIINYRNSRDVDIQFSDGTIRQHLLYGNIKKGYAAKA